MDSNEKMQTQSGLTRKEKRKLRSKKRDAEAREAAKLDPTSKQGQRYLARQERKRKNREARKQMSL